MLRISHSFQKKATSLACECCARYIRLNGRSTPASTLVKQWVELQRKCISSTATTTHPGHAMCCRNHSMKKTQYNYDACFRIFCTPRRSIPFTSPVRMLTVYRHSTLLRKTPRAFTLILFQHPVRYLGLGTRVVQIASRLLKIRYIILGSAVGGGYTLSQTIDSWKQYFPDLEWLKEYIPESSTIQQLTDHLQIWSQSIREAIPEQHAWLTDQISRIRTRTRDFIAEVKSDLLRGEALIAMPQTDLLPGEHGSLKAVLPFDGFAMASKPTDTGTDDESSINPKQRVEQIQDEMMQVQIRYQREIDRLEKENRELRKQLMLREQRSGKKRSMKKSLIDMYSDVLDDLAEYDSSYNTQDHLPRVVVVGDQSSGKTSVLEMVAQARIFPRGSGEMMTRSPVKVTLSEGPYHIAQFKDSNREFDLTKETDLSALRKEVEVRMKANVTEGQTVSSECIAMTVKGPGLQRMVLVDLPGIISTVTTDMAPDTRDCIRKICKTYMENPNAIILCIQDGSLDAERSNVTDLVSQMDPTGKRTIFVLTKVDLAESNLYNPNRIKEILAGRLFPMKALGYFAVVTGKGNSNDSIQTIKEYEETFFRQSRFFKDGVLKPTQMNTGNLSMAVSEVFWKMVKESVEQQADAFKATRFNLETEWKNTFPNVRELDREELFERARSEILDEIINLSQLTPKQWEDAFSHMLWEKMSTYVFEDIYLPAAQSTSTGVFNTTVDIRLKHWADKQLPRKCVEGGWETLQDQFFRIMEKNRSSKDHDDLFNGLKEAVREGSLKKHQWDNKAQDSLRVIQMNILEDRSISDKQQWDSALKFMEQSVKEKLDKVQTALKEMNGPSLSDQWLYWQTSTPEHKHRRATIVELEKIITSDRHHKSVLAADELTTVRRNLHTQGVEIDNDFIRGTWYHVFRKHFFNKSLVTAQECKKGFYYYQRGFQDTGLDCNDIVLFWRLQRMLQVTSNALRQQVMNNEARRLERNIKEVLEDIGSDKHKLRALLTGRRVQLAEELKRVRQIQDKLEEMVAGLNAEKQTYR